MDSAPLSIAARLFPARSRLLRGVAALGLGVALTLPLTVRAADDNTIFTPGAARKEAPVAGGGGFGSVSLVLGLLLAGAGGWLLWRQRRGTVTGRELRSLAIDETRSLGNRQFLVVASYEGRKFLLGVCPGRIDMLTPLDGSAPREKARE
ncbi:MAG: flagellar biosynthetic protein FliO [Opitutaceae bacterium]|nr:flagellar biosynthetic protein FliO [Opitutaceae bacterium]